MKWLFSVKTHGCTRRLHWKRHDYSRSPDGSGTSSGRLELYGTRSSKVDTCCHHWQRACLKPSSTAFDDQQKLRTFGENAGDAARYMHFVNGKSASFKKRAYQKFNNCVRPPLVTFEDDDIFLEMLTPNPLHMKLRTVNKVEAELEKAHPGIAKQFIERIGLKKERYHDEFEGRACSTICGRHEVVREIVLVASSVYVTKRGMKKRQRVSQRNAAAVKHPALFFADAFEALDGVMKYCYGAQLVPKYQLYPRLQTCDIAYWVFSHCLHAHAD